jgi:1-acyl-sn-glycerol-3-phosphate acyltransferase
MKPYAGFVNWVLRTFFGILCRLDTADLKNVPMHGPLILVANHVNFLEVPVVRASLHPRSVIGLTKVESFRNPLFNFLFHTWGGIPIERGTVDRAALQACSDALSEGKLLAVMPEGTRSGDGKLLQGKPGIVLLATRGSGTQQSGATCVPLLPVVCWGAEHFWENLKHFRRTPFHTRTGRPIVVDTHGEALSKDVRQRIADEIMFKLAELLPEEYHGVYPHPEREEYRYLREV